MKKRSMILAGVVMTVGLGIGGATAASATSTGAPKPEVGCAVKGGPTAMGEGKTTVKIDQDGKVFVDGKEAPKSKLRTLCKQPPFPGKGVACILKAKADRAGKGGKFREDTLREDTLRGDTFRRDTFRGDTFRGGKLFVDGKEAPKSKLRTLCKQPPFPGKGVACILKAKADRAGKGGKFREDTLRGDTFRRDTFRGDTFRGGKLFVDGKEAPKSKLRTLCKEPPLPGKGVVCIVHVKGGKSGEFGTSDEKVYVDGKPAPEGKAHFKCPLPKKLGEGMDDVHFGDDAPVAVTPN